ncbi:uncharacterized protein METZ01_LOCUS232811, partial [marine metagenome]
VRPTGYSLVIIIVQIPPKQPLFIDLIDDWLFCPTAADGVHTSLLQPLLVRVRGFDPPALKQKQLIA